jgi:hypothetical protein
MGSRANSCATSRSLRLSRSPHDCEAPHDQVPHTKNLRTRHCILRARVERGRCSNATRLPRQCAPKSQHAETRGMAVRWGTHVIRPVVLGGGLGHTRQRARSLEDVQLVSQSRILIRYCSGLWRLRAVRIADPSGCNQNYARSSVQPPQHIVHRSRSVATEMRRQYVADLLRTSRDSRLG